MWLSLICFTLFIVISTRGVYTFDPNYVSRFSEPIDEEDNIGKPLILSQLIKKGKYIEAQKLAKVSPNIGNVTSYSGYLTVDEECGSNLFFWFFPATHQKMEDAPLLLWLQGGPGYTSMFGLFEEIGPFQFLKGELKQRKYTWNRDLNLLIIDQPVGVGYSFTEGLCFSTDETEVGENLYSGISQFLEIFPRLKKNKFFIAGESYAGHYIPAIGHTIHKYNNDSSTKTKINLSAMMIGNGLMDPITQMDYGSFLYQIGLIDDAAKQEYSAYLDAFVKEVEGEKWEEASVTWTMLVGRLYYKHVGSGVNRYNYLEPFVENTNWEKFVQLPHIRKSLHVGRNDFSRLNTDVYYSLYSDIPRSVKPWIEELLEHYPIIFYNGQLDIMCGYPMAVNFMRSLSWSRQSHYVNATRHKWCVGEEQAGYFKGEHNLYDVLVRDAGHMVPTDQPLWAYILVNSVTTGTPDNPLHHLAPCPFI